MSAARKNVRAAWRDGARLHAPILAALVAVVAVAVYALTLRHASFRADDFRWIGTVATPEGVEWGRVLSYFYSSVPYPATSFYRPFYSLSVALDYAVWGTDPFGHVLTSVLLHAASAALVALITLELSGRRGAGFLAGLLFALYPTHPFSNNYVSERPNVLAVALSLLALFAYLRFRSGRGRGYLALSLVAFALALMSKETAASVPVVLLAYEVYRRTPWRYTVPLVGAFGPVLAAYFALRFAVLGQFLGGYEDMPKDPTAILPTLARYLGLMLAPYNPNLLGSDYSPTYVVTLIVAIALILSLTLKSNLRNLVLFLAAFFATFLPVVPLFMGFLNAFPGYGRYEWNGPIYLPSAFFCVGLALLISSLDRRMVGWAVAAGVVAFYAVVQPMNNRPWLEASELVRSAQEHPEQLPVSTHDGALVFNYYQPEPGVREYMGYKEAMSPWFRGSPPPPTERDGWLRTQGDIVKINGKTGELQFKTARDTETYSFDRRDLQIRLYGVRAGVRQLSARQTAYVGFVEKDGARVARSVEVYGQAEAVKRERRR